MKVTITLRLDPALLREVRMLAEEKGTSVSALPTAHLGQIIVRHKAYERARKRALARLHEGLDLQWTPCCARDQLHER
jgi:predicted transcriptional regulator